MSNTITIKNGPGNSGLAEGELGYNTTNNSLYIGTDGTTDGNKLAAAPVSHNHNASDINAGTLSVARGGTGAANASDARSNLGVPSTTGSGASGTWGISITGNAATATNASYASSAGSASSASSATNASYASSAGSASSASYATSAGSADSAAYLQPARTIYGGSHAEALSNEFANYKGSIPRNKQLTYYSSAYSNGSQYMGYFLSGYDTNPYGGFFVAHYNDPYYVGIASGSFEQQDILTSSNYSRWAAPASHSHSYAIADVLWTNASPGSSFGAQTVGVSNLSDYQYIIITARINVDDANAGNISSGLIPYRVGNTFPICGFFPDFWMHVRQATISSSSTIYFSSGYMRDTSGNNYNAWDGRTIPLQIIGIKGV